MTKTPYQRWQERTGNGTQLAGGWTHKSQDPSRIAQYWVRGHPHWGCLTWAYGNWWHQSVGDDRDGMSGMWHLVKGRYDWKATTWNHCSVNWGSVLVQAAELGNEEAKQERARIVEEYRRCTCYRSGCEGSPCPIHS